MAHRPTRAVLFAAAVVLSCVNCEKTPAALGEENQESEQVTELHDCFGGAAVCKIYGGTHLDLPCSKMYTIYDGQLVWPELTYVGPITIEVNAKRTSETLFPLYVDIVDPDEPGGSQPCGSNARRIVMVVQGTEECEGWEKSEPIDLAPWMAVGDTYRIRITFLHAFKQASSAPLLGCIRVAPVSPALSPR